MVAFPVCHWGGRFIDTGLNRRAERLTGLSGVSNGKAGTLAMFAKLRDFNQILHIRNAEGFLLTTVVVDDTGFGRFMMRDSAGGRVIDIAVGSHGAAANKWAWYGWSWDAGASRAAAYLNDTDIQGPGTYFDPAKDIEYSAPGIGFYAALSGGNNSRGCYAYVFFSTTIEYDFNVESNRRLFLNSDGSPVTTFPAGGIVQSETGDLSKNEGTGGNFDLPKGPFLRCVDQP